MSFYVITSEGKFRFDYANDYVEFDADDLRNTILKLVMFHEHSRSYSDEQIFELFEKCFEYGKYITIQNCSGSIFLFAHPSDPHYCTLEYCVFRQSGEPATPSDFDF